MGKLSAHDMIMAGYYCFMFLLLMFYNPQCFVLSQSPVVQSVVSLTSSLRVILLTILADSVYNILIFFAEKM